MSLKIKGWRKIVKWAFWSILVILLAVFIIRVSSFEANYYAEKEGSERDVAESSSRDELDETEPTADEVKEYTVAPDRPRYLTVERLGVKNARILPMGVNVSGELDTPRNIFDVGWYEGSSTPGQGGTLMIDGHNGGPTKKGVFKDLPSLKKGDEIKIERGDGKKFIYTVVENETVSLDDANEYMSVAARSPELGVESVTLISCTGEWSDQRDTYLSRQFVRATLVEE